VEIALGRLAQRGYMNRIDRETIGFHEQVRKGYLKMANRQGRIIRKIDGSRPVEVVAREIQQKIEPYLDRRHV